jgi:hypothetical protein
VQVAAVAMAEEEEEEEEEERRRRRSRQRGSRCRRRGGSHVRWPQRQYDGRSYELVEVCRCLLILHRVRELDHLTAN